MTDLPMNGSPRTQTLTFDQWPALQQKHWHNRYWVNYVRTMDTRLHDGLSPGKGMTKGPGHTTWLANYRTFTK